RGTPCRDAAPRSCREPSTSTAPQDALERETTSEHEPENHDETHRSPHVTRLDPARKGPAGQGHDAQRQEGPDGGDPRMETEDHLVPHVRKGPGRDQETNHHG